jgi:transcriptional regulator with XRE-family HTH domain
MSIQLFINIMPYRSFQGMKNSHDVRNILSGNIKAAREALRITQAKLAESAGIALPSLIGIEHCKTWVSDKTLVKIARALNMEVYELLVPPENTLVTTGHEKEALVLRQIAKLINTKKLETKKSIAAALDELEAQIIHLYSG